MPPVLVANLPSAEQHPRAVLRRGSDRHTHYSPKVQVVTVRPGAGGSASDFRTLIRKKLIPTCNSESDCCFHNWPVLTTCIWILGNCDITVLPDITAPDIGVLRISQSLDSDIGVTNISVSDITSPKLRYHSHRTSILTVISEVL
jgi:hypothetical protein